MRAGTIPCTGILVASTQLSLPPSLGCNVTVPQVLASLTSLPNSCFCQVFCHSNKKRNYCNHLAGMRAQSSGAHTNRQPMLHHVSRCTRSALKTRWGHSAHLTSRSVGLPTQYHSAASREPKLPPASKPQSTALRLANVHLLREPILLTR